MLARHRAYKLHKELFKTKAQNKDVHRPNFGNYVLAKAKNANKSLGDTFQRTNVHRRQWRIVTDGRNIFTESDYSSIEQILDVQTANGTVVSDTQAKVYIKESGAHLWIHLVKDSPSVLSLGKLCTELGHSYSWTTRETPRISKK